jgi:phage/plasmid-associated DNA primase
VDDTLLKVTSGEAVPLKILYSNARSGVVPARLMFHGNLVTDTTDSSGAIEKRMILLRTTDVLPDPVPEYHAQLLKEAPGILNTLVAAYARLRARGSFDIPDYSRAVAASMTRDSNSTSIWVADNCIPVKEVSEGTDTSALYAHYSEWCVANGMFRMSSVHWGKRVNELGFPVKNLTLGDGVSIARVRMLRFHKDSNIKVNY